MNKLRISNIGMNKQQQNTLGKTTATTTAQSSDLLLQAKKKRTAFGNLSNVWVDFLFYVCCVAVLNRMGPIEGDKCQG
jgi:hypothetical protein